MIKRTISSQDLLSKSQALVLCHGTMAFEAILCNKPVILCDTVFPLSKYKGIIMGNTADVIREAFEKIKKGYMPDYGDAVEYLNEYLISDRNSLVEHAVTILKEL